jgi:hypothetical protein
MEIIFRMALVWNRKRKKRRNEERIKEGGN